MTDEDTMIQKIKKYIIHIQSNLLQKGIIKPKLRQLNIFVTNRCNFSCFYCNRNVNDKLLGVSYKYKNGSDFKFDDLILLLNKYPTITRVSFVGIGEPFLNKDLLLMAQYAKMNGKYTSVITNGSLLHQFWGEIGKSFDSISISLHGLSPIELHIIAGVKEQIFQQFSENIQYLCFKEKKQYPHLSIRASVVMLKNNLSRVRSAANFCVENSITELDIQNFLPVDLNDSNNCVFDDEPQYKNFINELIEDYTGTLKINSPTLIKRDKKNLSWNCTTFFNTLRVDGLGQVCGCCRIMIPKAENGNIHYDSDVWNNTYFIQMREKFWYPNRLPECCRFCPDSQ